MSLNARVLNPPTLKYGASKQGGLTIVGSFCHQAMLFSAPQFRSRVMARGTCALTRPSSMFLINS